MKLLFVTRKFPPAVGGMEQLSAALAIEFSNLADTTVISWGGSQIYLPFFLMSAFIKSLYLIPSKKITHIHLGDALLSPLGLFLKFIFSVKSSVTVHGLDITYRLPIYQLIIPKAANKLDKIICVSLATKKECIKRGIEQNKCAVIPNGIYPSNFKINANKKDLENIIGVSLDNKKVMVTVGRLVKRKGVYWFIKNVVPCLPKNYLYLVVGEGPEKEKIIEIINKLNLHGSVLILGRIPDHELSTIYSTTDIFIMPNIKVKGDIEGFGIVALEATSYGLPVVASDLEGIKDAVIDRKNGILVHPEDKEEFIKAITKTVKILDKKSIKDFTIKNYSWHKIAKEYIYQLNPDFDFK